MTGALQSQPSDKSERRVAPAGSLPRLLYMGDVPVEASLHGSALLHRLLQGYPPERLLVVENMHASLDARRLPQVDYRWLPMPWRRLMHTRLQPWALSALWLRAPGRARQLAALSAAFAPQAVLSVAHGWGWLTASAFARRHGLPLHLIVHDDCPNLSGAVWPVRSWVARRFQQSYRQAASRLCVSPFMVEEYRRRYGATGSVLYPCRAADAAVSENPPERLRGPRPSLTVAFAGSIVSQGYWDALRALAQALARIQGRLKIFGPAPPEAAAAAGVSGSHVELCGMVTSRELILRCRDEADVLFLPMSFAADDRCNMELGFPSKLTDYTAIGLPLLIYGPEYCSAVRWAAELPGVAQVVTVPGEDALAAALAELRDPQRRWGLAAAAIARGLEFFDHSRVVAGFLRCLSTEAPRHG